MSDANSFVLIEESEYNGQPVADQSGQVVEKNGAVLQLKDGGGVYYAHASGPLRCVAMHGTKLVASDQSGELHFLEWAGAEC